MSTGFYRPLPGHPSKHGANVGAHRSRPPWSSSPGAWRGETVAIVGKGIDAWRGATCQMQPGAGGSGRYGPSSLLGSGIEVMLAGSLLARDTRHRRLGFRGMAGQDGPILWP